jgi:hypothetical protein
MTVEWKLRKTKNRFPPISTALGNRSSDSHIPTAPTAGPPYVCIRRTPLSHDAGKAR